MNAMPWSAVDRMEWARPSRCRVQYYKPGTMSVDAARRRLLPPAARDRATANVASDLTS